VIARLATVAPRARSVADAVERVDRRAALAALVGLQWVVIAALALRIHHNGFLFHNGGDGTYYWTTTWALAHRMLPETVISYGLPVLLWPLGLVFGTSMLPALPVVVVLQIVVLAPLGVIALFALADRIGGRLFAYTASLMWILAPFAVLRYFRPDFRSDFRTFALPGPLGLTNLADYPSMILAIVVGWLVVRALEERRWNDVVLAGLACGFLIAVKPSNGVFVPAPVAAFLVVRRWREAGAFLAAMAPALVTLALWKAVGLGRLPILGASVVSAAGTHGTVVADSITTRYLPFDWHTFTLNLARLREVGWSLRLAEYLPIAGVVGAWRRGRPYGVLLALWFLAYFVVKGGAKGRSDVYALSFFRLTMPGFPAYVLLAACIVFLVPGLARRWRARAERPEPIRWTRGLIVAAAVLAAYPLAFVAVSHAAPSGKIAKDNAHNLLVPITGALHVRLHGATLDWRRSDTGASTVSYAVYRDTTDGCIERTSGAHDCEFSMRLAAILTQRTWTDPRPGRWIYRVGVVGDPLGRPRQGDLLVLSPPVSSR
jgi:Dolichyl-phosphate-mannose-protein mannosyltransferase